MTSFEQVVASQRRWGQATYSAWDPRAFDALVDSAGSLLWQTLGGDGQAPASALEAYLQLSQEALAIGVWSETTSPGFFGRLWFRLTPRLAAAIPRNQLVARFVELWNLCEGLRNAGRWLDLAVGLRLDSLTELASVEAVLEQVLSELVTPGMDPAWKKNPCRILDLRPMNDRFLPGPMHLLAPRVVCVHDRRDDEQCMGLWLRPEQKGIVLGRIDCGQTYEDPRRTPEVEFTPANNIIRIDGRVAVAPAIGSIHSSLTLPAGFVIASAIDSQRVWVVGSG